MCFYLDVGSARDRRAATIATGGDPARCDYVAVVGCGNVRVSSVVKPGFSLLYEVRGRLLMAVL